jgi:hypothetical protein
MLAVSVSFLAVPGVILYSLNVDDNGHQVLIFKSSSQIASTISVETSIGSIVIGMFLVRHNRTKQEASPSEAVSEQSPYMRADATFAQIAYLDQYFGSLGIETMAIIFSLPWALLMWSYAVSCLQDYNFADMYGISPPPTG